MKKIKIEASEITWYEDGFLLEWWINDSIDPKNKRTIYASLDEAIDIAKKNNILLCIQPMFQDQVIFVDYTQKCNNCGHRADEHVVDKYWCNLRDEPVHFDDYCKFWVGE